MVEESGDGGAYGLLWNEAGGDHEGVGTSTKSQDSAFVGDGTTGIAGVAGIALVAPPADCGLRGLNSFGAAAAVGWGDCEVALAARRDGCTSLFSGEFFFNGSITKISLHSVHFPFLPSIPFLPSNRKLHLGHWKANVDACSPSWL